jgi:hypothetical protein
MTLESLIGLQKETLINLVQGSPPRLNKKRSPLVIRKEDTRRPEHASDELSTSHPVNTKLTSTSS